MLAHDRIFGDGTVAAVAREGTSCTDGTATFRVESAVDDVAATRRDCVTNTHAKLPRITALQRCGIPAENQLELSRADYSLLEKIPGGNAL